MIVPWIDIATAAYDAGFRGEDLSVAIALSQPESQRTNDAVNHEDPNGGSFGLLQINGVHDPNATGVYPNLVPTEAWIQLMFNPKENYKAAFKVYMRAGRKFDPWGTYTNGAYLLKWHDPVDVAKVAMDARQRIAAVQTSLTSRTTQLAEANRLNVAMVDELRLVTAERDRLSSERDRLTGELSAAKDQLKAQQATIDALQGKIESAKIALG